MVRSTAPSVLPSGKVISGRLLDNAGAMVKTKIDKIIRSETVHRGIGEGMTKQYMAINYIYILQFVQF